MKIIRVLVFFITLATLLWTSFKAEADEKSGITPQSMSPASKKNEPIPAPASASDALKSPSLKVDPEVLRRAREEALTTTSIVVHVSNSDPKLALKQSAAARFRKMTWAPAQRLEHFRWLSEDSPIQTHLRQLGKKPLRSSHWKAEINEIIPTPQGWIATLQITPELGRINSMSFIRERYALVNGKLRFLGAEVPPSGRFLGLQSLSYVF